MTKHQVRGKVVYLQTIMRKYILLLGLFTGGLIFSQEASENVFTKSEAGQDEISNNNPQQPTPGESTEDTGNPGDVLPIDNYIPALIFLAVSMIVVAGSKKIKKA